MMIEKNDRFADFDLSYSNGSFTLNLGSRFPDEAREYLEKYLSKIARYKNVSRRGDCFWSLYQPPLPHPAGKRNLYYRLKRRFQQIKVPAVATYGATRHCQCSCEHCSADYHMGSARDMDNTAMKNAILEGVDLGVCNVIFVGGEPLLRKDLEEIISSVPEEKAIVTMFTNGEYLSAERAGTLKAANLYGLFFSLDSTDPGEHDRLRKRKGLFERCIEGIKNAREAGLYTAISTYITSENYAGGQVRNMMGLGKELGVDEVTFFDAIPTGRFTTGASACLTDRDRVGIIEDAKRYRKDEEYPAMSAQSCITSEFGKGFCYAGNTQFYLSSSGEFCPCDFSPLTIGSYPEKSIKELWTDLTDSIPYQERSHVCRMQEKTFRSRFIDTIPRDAVMPYPIKNFT
jgi:MoaA/NifB/PqqE/SkfB family radical SAM enzyme